MMKHERKDVPKKKRKAWTETQLETVSKNGAVRFGVPALTKHLTCDDIGY
jgi:hypothetical protein